MRHRPWSLLIRLSIWRHGRLGFFKRKSGLHIITSKRVSVLLFSTDRGVLYTCSCGKVWAE